MKKIVKESLYEELSASEALFGFGGWLTTRDEAVTFSAKDDAAKMAELIDIFIKKYNLKDPRENWDDQLVSMNEGFKDGIKKAVISTAIIISLNGLTSEAKAQGKFKHLIKAKIENANKKITSNFDKVKDKLKNKFEVPTIEIKASKDDSVLNKLVQKYNLKDSSKIVIGIGISSDKNFAGDIASAKAQQVYMKAKEKNEMNLNFTNFKLIHKETTVSNIGGYKVTKYYLVK